VCANQESRRAFLWNRSSDTSFVARFELAGTEDRFGWFDRNDIGYDGGRSAAKAERIGKKYQWIAYHEVLAFISTTFNIARPFATTRTLVPTMGPWQNGIRDM